MYCLIGVDWLAMEDLLKHGAKTFELVSCDNVSAARKLKPRDRVFATNMGKQDLKKGLEGVLAEVKRVETSYRRTFISGLSGFEENELLTARIQLEYIDYGRIRKITDLGLGEGTEVDVETHVILG